MSMESLLPFVMLITQPPPNVDGDTVSRTSPSYHHSAQQLQYARWFLFACFLPSFKKVESSHLASYVHLLLGGLL
jgi:hypothetical protein